jgi:transposase
MDITTLLTDPAAIRLEYFISDPKAITVVIKTIQAQPYCPKCNQPSTSLHSHYQRSPADLPWHGVAIKLQLHTRKIRCLNQLCRQKIFCERLPKVVAVYARKTVRLNQALTLLAFALGGEAGARTACQLNLKISGDSLLRRIRGFALPPTSSPSVLGVDDFAFRRGHRYGTILVDLQQRKVIDLLPDREAATLATWLKAHSGVQVVTRDRSGAYAEGIRIGAPQAEQVADRWHLLKNLRETLERALQARQSSLQTAAEVIKQLQRCSSTVIEPGETTMLSSRNGKQSQHSRERRLARYAKVQSLQQRGLSIRGIARSLKMSRMTVYRYLGSEGFPERAPTKKRSSKLDSHLPYLHRRWAEGYHNAGQLWREISTQGYSGKEAMVRRYVRRLRSRLQEFPEKAKARTQISASFQAPCARQSAWWLLKEGEDLKEEERQFVTQLLALCPEIKTVKEQAEEFWGMVRGREERKFRAWMQTVKDGSSKEMKGFAEGLRRDQEAVEGALRSSWSNGQTEGQVNRLKLLKRQMYGRAKLDLLRARVLHKV